MGACCISYVIYVIWQQFLLYYQYMFGKIKKTVVSAVALLILGAGFVALSNVLGMTNSARSWDSYYLFAQVLGIVTAVTVGFIVLFSFNKK